MFGCAGQGWSHIMLICWIMIMVAALVVFLAHRVVGCGLLVCLVDF